MMSKKNIFKLLGAMALSGALLFPAAALAKMLIPKGLVPNPPPLQPHSSLIKPGVSANIGLAPAASSSSQAGNADLTGSGQASETPNNPAATEPADGKNIGGQPAAGSGLWGQTWLWLAFLAFGCGAGYWLIARDKGKN